MKKEDSIDFDMSKLSLDELIKVYEDINLFISYLEENKMVEEGEENNG